MRFQSKREKNLGIFGILRGGFKNLRFCFQKACKMGEIQPKYAEFIAGYMFTTRNPKEPNLVDTKTENMRMLCVSTR